MSLSNIINPAGGLYYHLKAMRYSRNLWNSFREELNKSLNQWEPTKDELVIIGASGGYCLKPEFLEKFQKVWICEPDPIARKVFTQRFSTPIGYIDKDYLSRPRYFESLSTDLNNYAILFSNVWGQMGLLNSNFEEEKEQYKALWNKLSHWFSYHDVFSFGTNREISSDEWKALRKSKWEAHSLSRFEFVESPVIDHISYECLPQTPYSSKHIWMHRPRYLHLIEARWQNC